jgi:hypothetical protein
MLKEYKVQRKASQWIETTVLAESLENALEVADAKFEDGRFTEAEDAFEIDEEAYWVQTHDGLVFTDLHAPAEPRKH